MEKELNNKEIKETEKKTKCQFRIDGICVRASCPYVADFCPVAKEDSICKYRG